jgi:hypothetical protein
MTDVKPDWSDLNSGDSGKVVKKEMWAARTDKPKDNDGWKCFLAWVGIIFVAWLLGDWITPQPMTPSEAERLWNGDE